MDVNFQTITYQYVFTIMICNITKPKIHRANDHITFCDGAIITSPPKECYVEIRVVCFFWEKQSQLECYIKQGGRDYYIEQQLQQHSKCDGILFSSSNMLCFVMVMNIYRFCIIFN